MNPLSFQQEMQAVAEDTAVKQSSKLVKSTQAAVATFGVLALMPIPALAHGSHMHLSSISAGFQHPWLGLDHAMVLVASGVWLAMQKNTRTALTAGLVLMGLLALGMFAGSQMPAFNLEWALIASLVMTGALCAAAPRFANRALFAGLGVVGAVHGLVHGLEMPAGDLNFAAGLMVSSATILGAVFVCGRVLANAGKHIWLRSAGAAAALVGVAASI